MVYWDTGSVLTRTALTFPDSGAWSLHRKVADGPQISTSERITRFADPKMLYQVKHYASSPAGALLSILDQFRPNTATEIALAEVLSEDYEFGLPGLVPESWLSKQRLVRTQLKNKASVADLSDREVLLELSGRPRVQALLSHDPSHSSEQAIVEIEQALSAASRDSNYPLTRAISREVYEAAESLAGLTYVSAAHSGERYWVLFSERVGEMGLERDQPSESMTEQIVPVPRDLIATTGSPTGSKEYWLLIRVAQLQSGSKLFRVHRREYPSSITRHRGNSVLISSLSPRGAVLDLVSQYPQVAMSEIPRRLFEERVMTTFVLDRSLRLANFSSPAMARFDMASVWAAPGDKTSKRVLAWVNVLKAAGLDGLLYPSKADVDETTVVLFVPSPVTASSDPAPIASIVDTASSSAISYADAVQLSSRLSEVID